MQAQFILLCAFFACVLVQVWCSLLNKNIWPFVAQGMFAYRYDRLIKCMLVSLFDEAGNEVIVLPERVLPVASFRAQRMMIQIFSPDSNQFAAEQFAELLLSRLNHGPWKGFDEIEPSVRPGKGGDFVGFSLYACELDLGLVSRLDRNVGVEDALVTRNLLYEYFSNPALLSGGDSRP